jgi:hypothetical protein
MNEAQQYNHMTKYKMPPHSSQNGCSRRSELASIARYFALCWIVYLTGCRSVSEPSSKTGGTAAGTWFSILMPPCYLPEEIDKNKHYDVEVSGLSISQEEVAKIARLISRIRNTNQKMFKIVVDNTPDCLRATVTLSAGKATLYRGGDGWEIDSYRPFGF